VLDVRAGRDPRLAARLAQGIYARPGGYPATLRFSNSDPGVRDDRRPDLHGLAVCVECRSAREGADLAPGRQDYSLQSAPALAFNDMHALAVFAKVFAAPSQAVALGALPLRDQLLFAQTMQRVTRQTRQPVRPYQQLRYWSAAPFRHGARDVVKYSAWPAPANAARPLETGNPDALRDELVRHLEQDAVMSAFDFGVQLLEADRMTHAGRRRDAAFWIENAAVEWPEAQAPFHRVARLTLLPRSQLDAEACEAVCVDVASHCTADSAPLGGVSRARSHAVAASRRARLGVTAAPAASERFNR
jgi:hypothetical protein